MAWSGIPAKRTPFSFGLILHRGLLRNPAECLGGDMCQNKQVLLSEGIAGFPLVTILVAALERGVETRAFVGGVFPDSGTKSVDTDFVRGFIRSRSCRLCGCGAHLS